MGNCSIKGVTGECSTIIRVLTSSRGIIEFKGPRLVKDVLNGYPGHGIFRQGHASSPLAGHEYLIGGQMYYLLPLQEEQMLSKSRRFDGLLHYTKITKKLDQWIEEIKSPKMSPSAASNFVEDPANAGPALQVLPSPGKGMWRVKLVIDTEQLEEILSEQANIQALIEKMRMAASSANFTPRRSRRSWGTARKAVG